MFWTPLKKLAQGNFIA